jgi:hypothetical protein
MIFSINLILDGWDLDLGAMQDILVSRTKQYPTGSLGDKGLVSPRAWWYSQLPYTDHNRDHPIAIWLCGVQVITCAPNNTVINLVAAPFSLTNTIV